MDGVDKLSSSIASECPFWCSAIPFALKSAHIKNVFNDFATCKKYKYGREKSLALANSIHIFFVENYPRVCKILRD